MDGCVGSAKLVGLAGEIIRFAPTKLGAESRRSGEGSGGVTPEAEEIA